ncbi:MAG: hypothetical protein L3J67_04175 [Hyphomicrobiaceae bacterium]|nr:hypothetical protein [Hyphomicrobiaceae bacterium]
MANFNLLANFIFTAGPPIITSIDSAPALCSVALPQKDRAGIDMATSRFMAVAIRIQTDPDSDNIAPSHHR